jgi:plastocyanin
VYLHPRAFFYFSFFGFSKVIFLKLFHIFLGYYIMIIAPLIFNKNMNTRKVLITLAVIIVAGLGYYFFAMNKKQALAPEKGQQTQQTQEPQNNQNPNLPQNQDAQNAAPSSTKPSAQSGTPAQSGQFSSGQENDLGADILVVQVNFDGNSFSPSAAEIKAGDVVIFKNNSSEDFWPASNPHPVHTDYPGFDAKKAVSPGGTYQFKFDNAGTWGYHDHLNPSITGTIKVDPK